MIRHGLQITLLSVLTLLALSACTCGKEKRCATSAECDTGTCQNGICVENGVGAPCQNADECRIGLSCNGSLPEGYCTALCAGADACPTGTACVVRGGQGLCMLACSADTTCRSGYTCSGKVCDLPCTEDAECGGGESCQSGKCRDSTAGKACTGDLDCLTPLTCFSGVCTAACTTFADCPAGAACGLEGGDRHCVAACRAEIDCGAEKLCLGGGCVAKCSSDADCGDGVCDLPTGQCSGVNGVRTSVIELGDVRAGTAYPVQVPDGAFALTIQVQGAPGRELSFTSVKKPDGTELVNGGLGGMPEPLQVLPQTEVITAQLPLGDDPRLTVVPGSWTFTFRGGAGAARVWIKTSVDGQSHGGEVDLNVFIAPGAFNGVDAASAPTNSFVQDTLASWQRFYTDQADIAVVNTRYFDLAPQWSDVQASTSSADAEINDMWKLGRSDGINVFFVRSIGGGFGGIAGIAGGIPGAPLTGGTAHSGIAVEVQRSAQITGIDFCHEAGHFQGLFHLSEFFGQGHDPIDDTPQCSPPNGNCSEPERHMMYPALNPRQKLISPNSARVLQANAGVR